MANTFDFNMWNAMQNLPMTWGPGGNTRNDEAVNKYLKGDPQRYFNFKMPGNLSPAMRNAYGTTFNDVYGEYENQIAKQAKQTGQLPTTQFTDWLDTFDWNNWYAAKTPMNNRYNFANGLRWY